MPETETSEAMAGPQVKLLLQRALDHINRSQAFEAEGILSDVLATSPNDADALQLLGVLRRLQGRDSEAEALYRKSLAANPNQPQVHHNLGNLLRRMGRLPEAVAAQRDAVRLRPNYAEAHLNLGLALAEVQDLAGAEKSIRRALYIQPNFLLAKQNLGAILTEQDRATEAETVLRQALASNPGNPRQVAALEHNLGVALAQQRRYDEALQLFEKVQAKVPETANLDRAKGNTLEALGKRAAAADSYRLAVIRDSLDMAAHRDLNHLLYRSGADAEFLRSYDDAMALHPEIGALPLAKGDLLLRARELDAAREAYDRAAYVLPDHPLPHDGLAQVLARQGQFEAAIREHEIALSKEMNNPQVLRNFSETLLRAGDARKALTHLQKNLELNPYDQASLALSSVAFRMLNDPREEALNDYENFVQTFELAPPAGYDDMESFNRDLNRALDEFHVDRREAVDQSIRGGTQTIYDLFGRRTDLVSRLKQRIDEAVSTYISRLREMPSHPLMARRAGGFGYAGSWSSRLHDCGFHDNHFHQMGWLSSAYYVALPETVSDTVAKEGWLRFGEPAFDAGLKDPVRRVVQPVPGKLVLFPSYMWHGTVPFHSNQARTTIAFDVVPKER